MSETIIIPARGGSKGIPRKNLQMLCGESLIARVVRTCKQAGFSPYVSTDDAEIAQEATRVGARVINRPAALATDEATTDDVLVHAARSLLWARGEQDLIVCVHCTTPFLVPQDITGALEMFRKGVRPGCVMGVHRCAKFIYAKKYDPQVPPGVLIPVNMEWGERPRRQDWPAQYQENGMVHVVSGAQLCSLGTRVVRPVVPFVIDASRAVDIDSMHDLEYCRWRLNDGAQ